jgi:hypothetical protein
MPETLAGSAEFAKFCPFKNEDQADIMTLYKKLTAEGQMQKENMKHMPNTVKANLLLHAYLTGVDCPPKLKDDQNMILSKSMHLIKTMLELSSQMGWLQTTKSIIQFSQLVTQGLWVKDSGLLQIPHFTSQIVKRLLSGALPGTAPSAHAWATRRSRKWRPP